MRIRLSLRRGPGLLAVGFLLGFALVVVAAEPPLLDVLEPSEGSVVGLGGVEVTVVFAEGERVAPGTFRVLLNGADMTSRFTTGRNGAHGRLFGLLDGENRLRFEVFGRRWWLPGMLLEEAREVRFLVRLPQDTNRA
jgi:hypothetical protein